MKDSGCQVNFVSERLAKEENFNIVKRNYRVIVNGFNIPKEYFTNIVRFEIRLGTQCYTLEAICVPSIDINLKLPHLGKIVTRFTEKGYQMADRFLTGDSEEISNIDIVLGAASSYCIAEKTVLFGNRPKPSAYYSSDLGVILIGDTKDMLKNLGSLPSAIQNNTYLT